MPAERHFRAFARRAINLPATVATPSQGPAPVRLMNLGLGGACIELAAPPSVGASVTLEVTAPNLWDPLVVPGTIVWVRAGAAVATGGAPGASAAQVGLAFDHSRKSALPALVELLAAYRFE